MLITGHMNAVEIEAAISDLALQPFDTAEFPYAFLAAIGEKETALKRLRSGNTNASDVPDGVLQRNKIHIAACGGGAIGDTIACTYADFPNHLGFFLPLAGISTIKETKGDPIDVRTTGRLEKLFELYTKMTAEKHPSPQPSPRKWGERAVTSKGTKGL